MQRLLTPAGAEEPATLRALQPGDLGWVVARHGALYSAEHGWDQRFEALVARIVANYVDRLDTRREAAWIAELNGLAMGCVFLVQARHDKTHRPLPGVAQLRLLLVEPAARGRGLGKLLVQQCHRFATQAGYREVRLWTNSLLLAARGIYQAAGYRLLSSEAHHNFGHALVGEVWSVDLRTAAPKTAVA
jgi:GNAT superfamily N-acetyltransferase